MKIIKEKVNKINIAEGYYVERYLESLGIAAENVVSFLAPPDESCCDNPEYLDNMDSGLKMMKEVADTNGLIYLQPDCDVDGFTSAAIFYNYFKTFYPSLVINYKVHGGKEHGITIDDIPENTKLVVIPDAGSMQLEEQKSLSARGIKVLILDHHDVTDQNPADVNVAIINNQISARFKNKSLSGAGVVLMFIKQYDCTYGQGMLWRKYLDLAALGIISDVMDTRTVGNNYIIYNGLNCVRNKLFQQLLQHQSFHIADISRPNKVDIAFYVSPIINGLIRSGKQDEKETFFKAMCDNSSTELITTSFRGKDRTETLYEYAVRMAVNAKSRQDTAKKRGSAILNQKIKTMHLDEHKILAVPISGKELEEIPSTLTGLTAMELLKAYNKPTMVLRENIGENEITYSGSLRSKDFFGFPSFAKFINDSHLALYAEGHDNAAGVSFTASGLKTFIDYCDVKLKDVAFDNDTIEVDYWFKDAVNEPLLHEFAQYSYLWGTGIPQPKFAFSFDLDSKEVSLIGQSSDTIKFHYSNIDFVMFKQPKIALSLKNSVKNRITCVGRAQVNTFNNTIQVVIDSMDLTPIKSVSAMDLI